MEDTSNTVRYKPHSDQHDGRGIVPLGDTRSRYMRTNPQKTIKAIVKTNLKSLYPQLKLPNTNSKGIVKYSSECVQRLQGHAPFLTFQAFESMLECYHNFE